MLILYMQWNKNILKIKSSCVFIKSRKWGFETYLSRFIHRISKVSPLDLRSCLTRWKPLVLSTTKAYNRLSTKFEFLCQHSIDPWNCSARGNYLAENYCSIFSGWQSDKQDWPQSLIFMSWNKLSLRRLTWALSKQKWAQHNGAPLPGRWQYWSDLACCVMFSQEKNWSG